MKLFIIGIVASGKTTMAKKLSQQLHIPHYELDSIVHVRTEAGDYKRTPAEQAQEIQRINQAGGWIMEGVYRESYHCVLDLADQILFLDPPLWLRYFRILFRFCKQQLGLEACLYRSDFKMLKAMFKWTKGFEQKRPQFEAMLAAYQEKLVRITRNDCNSYLTLLQQQEVYYRRESLRDSQK